jgi:hypothetical protein
MKPLTLMVPPSLRAAPPGNQVEDAIMDAEQQFSECLQGKKRCYKQSLYLQGSYNNSSLGTQVGYLTNMFSKYNTKCGKD